MKAKKQLRKPENWQDFEQLCKKLWGEIWKCPEIKKNGRSGQAQHGVDVYGNPYGEKDYYGIQCKGKDDYTNSVLTEKEIDKEIELATSFEPLLRKLYFATTATKDAKIETYVRKKNIENIEKGLFEIHLFSWEDIVDLIDENKQTYDYYVNSMNFISEHKVEFLFENDSVELESKIPFKKIINKYELKEKAEIEIDKYFLNFISDTSYSFNSFNKSYCRFYFRLHNIGEEPLREFKIFLNFDGEFESIDTCRKGSVFSPNVDIEYDTFIWDEDKQGKIVPFKNILVQGDSIGFDTICLKPRNDKISTIKINWKLVSLNFKDQGVLTLKTIPDYEIEEKTHKIEDKNLVGLKEEIKDIITN